MFRQRKSDALESVRQHPPGRVGPCWGDLGSGEKGLFFFLDKPALLYGANLELGGGEDRA